MEDLIDFAREWDQMAHNSALFAARDAALFGPTLTPQIVRDTWQDDRNRVAVMLDSLSEPAYNRLVVDYWRQYGHPNGVTLVDIHLAFLLVRFWPSVAA